MGDHGQGRMRTTTMRAVTCVTLAGGALAGAAGLAVAAAGPAGAESLQACEVLYQPGGVTNQGSSASFLAHALQPLGQTVSAVSATIEVPNCPPPQG